MLPIYDLARKPVDQWLGNLPLAPRLSNVVTSRNLTELATLTPEQIKEISSLYFVDFQTFLYNEISKLRKALSIAHEYACNPKFQVYQGNFGNIMDFHIPLYDVIGAPNPHWEEGMKLEHKRNKDKFTTSNYNIETCPEDEWDFVVEGKQPKAEHMGGGRIIKNIEVLIGLDESVKAGLTRAEVIALVLYTGPMFLVYNTVLRKFPQEKYVDLMEKDSLFPTTIFVLMSAIQKLARVMVLESGILLYRGIDGNMELPSQCLVPDETGCRGMMEFGFMSTTKDINAAISYSKVGDSRAPKVISIEVGAVDRGADISLYSQYAGEKEVLWNPHAFLEPTGVSELITTEKGVVQVIKMKANANTKAVTIDEYEKRKMQLHIASVKLQMQDLSDQLNNMSDPAKDLETTKRYIAQCMEECRAVKEKHQQVPAAAYNNDTDYRGLVTELLESKKFAITKMECLLECAKIDEENYKAKPMRMCFRDHMSDLVLKLKTCPNLEEALRLCKLFGLLVHGVTEKNELGEPPLITAIADGVTDDKLELLLQAGCDVNERMDYPGLLRKGMTPMLTAAQYGRASMVTILADRGGDVTAVSGTGVSCLLYAAQNGHLSTVEVLANLGVDLNLPRPDGSTPLYISAEKGHVSVVEALAKPRIDINTALAKPGADLNKADKKGCTPLFIAAYKGHVSVVEALARLGADLNKANNDGCTPLFIAAYKGHASVVEALARLGADLNKADRKGCTPLQKATEKGHVMVVQALQRLGQGHL